MSAKQQPPARQLQRFLRNRIMPWPAISYDTTISIRRYNHRHHDDRYDDASTMFTKSLQNVRPNSYRTQQEFQRRLSYSTTTGNSSRDQLFMDMTEDMKGPIQNNHTSDTTKATQTKDPFRNPNTQVHHNLPPPVYPSPDDHNTHKNNSTQQDPRDPLGTIVGAWIFCRHGDRSPARPLCPTQNLEAESYFWLTKLPLPSTAVAYSRLCRGFPPLIHDPTGHFVDVHRNPYGFVTHKGLQQCQHNGRVLRARYDPVFGVLQSQQGIATEQAVSAARHAVLQKWRIKAYSTNYLRTVLSMQAILDGFLATNLYAPPMTTGAMEERDVTTLGRAQEWPVPDHDYTNMIDADTPPFNQPQEDYTGGDNNNHVHDSNAATDDDEARDETEQHQQQQFTNTTTSHPQVFVRVRDQSRDNLNAFDRNPDLMRDLVAEVMQNAQFQQHDATAAPLAAKLANHLPGLARKGRKDFSAATPSGINWVEVADHFVCRRSHNLPLSKFCAGADDDPAIEHSLQSMMYPALGHLAWRFRQWYQNPQLLAAIAAPPLREVAQQLQHATTQSQQPHATDHNFLHFYSCHDVTLLALLYALGADFLADESSVAWREYWPAYASTLAIELVRLDGHPRHVMRILINGRIVSSTDFLFQKFARDQTQSKAGCSTTADNAETAGNDFSPLGTGPHDLLTTEDFWKLVRHLEHAGDYDFKLWPAMREEQSPAGSCPSKVATRSNRSSLDKHLN